MLGSLIFANEAQAGIGLHELSLLWSSAIVIGVVLATAIVAGRQTGLVPKGVAAIYEHIFDWLEGLAAGFMGREGRNYVPLATSFFLYILMSNWLGLIPWPSWHDEHGHELAVFESPTISISTTLALALLAVSAFNLFGLKKALFPPAASHGHGHGHGDEGHAHHGGLGGWLARFIDPVPNIARELSGPLKLIAIPLLFLFLMLNIMERFLPLVSLSLRLYGNISAKHTVKVSLLSMMQAMVTSGSISGMALGGVLMGSICFVYMLGALAGFLQAMIFTVLLLSYIGHAVHAEH